MILASVAFAQTVVVLDHLEDPAETAWIEELTLALPARTPTGEASVITRTPPPEFARTPLTEQLAVVRPMLDLEGAHALAWLNSEPDVLHLSVAFVAADRAVVRVVDVDREAGAPARLALATRELVAQALDLPTIPEARKPEPEGVPVARLAIGLGAVLPVSKRSGGLRAAVDVEGTAPVGPVWIGGSLGVQLNGHHVRAVPRGVFRAGPVVAAVGADVAVLEWVTWVQPRLEVGVTVEPQSIPIFFEPRLRVTPVRDQVVATERIYDSGWVEIGLHMGLARRVRRNSRQIEDP